ncbi:MAG: hypothetical protein IPM82_23890 [Saprospiraceae bacterium]|nr:hypothetical protein [Saprospiraceae bacterium]
MAFEVASGKFYQLLMLPLDRCHEEPFEREERRAFSKPAIVLSVAYRKLPAGVHSHEVLEEVLGG